MPYYEPTASTARYICLDMEDGELVPSIGAALPASIPLLQPFSLTLNGTGFRPGDVVRIGIVDVVPTSVSSSELVVPVLGALVAALGLVPVVVVRGGYTSNLLNLSVTL